MRPNNSGVILITTLWILAILTIFAVGFGYRMGLELKICGYNRDREQALYIAKAGLERAIVELEKDETPPDALNDSWSNNEELFKDISVGNGTFTITYPFGEEKVFFGLVDEERKININEASREVLLGLPEMTEEIASSIIDWRNKDGGFEVLEELLLVKGVGPREFSSLKDFLTVYGEGKVNVNTAPEEVLEALGLSETLAEDIIDLRKGSDGEEGTEDDMPFADVNSITGDLGVVKELLKTTSDNFTVNIKAVVKKAAKEVVAVLGPSGKGGLIVTSWREN